jgi:23S rRNA (cytosine1962-C5)-methyltransferase
MDILSHRKYKDRMKTLILKRGEERRLRVGHLWVFSNEVDVQRTPLKDFAPGEAALVMDDGGRCLGTAYVNPASLICARLVSRRENDPLNADMLKTRIGRALALRQALFDTPHYRLCFGEGDMLPGLVVDRYGDTLVAQITTAGMDAQTDAVVAALVEATGATGVLLRNDTASRELEGLPREVRVAYGSVPDTTEISENGCTFTVPLTAGQKTGWFYDQRDNRAFAARFAKGQDVLDVFCYVGSFGATAARAGAASVTLVDASLPAVELAVENVKANGRAYGLGGVDDADGIEGDAFEAMTELRREGRRFGLVCLDPPAFIKRRKDAKQGLTAYQRANELALDLVADGGVFVTCSCSQHLDREELRRVLTHAAAKRKMQAQIIAQGHQGADHPVHPAMAETDYLKSFTARIFRA